MTLAQQTYSALHVGDTNAQTVTGLTIAATLFYLGLDLLDEQMDGELPADWNRVGLAEITLLATTLFAVLSPLALMELDAPLTIRAAMQTRSAQALLLLSAGQQQDVYFAGQSVATSEQILASVEAKGGEELALFAAWGAMLAEAPDMSLEAESVRVETLAAFGRALGTAAQLASDLHDLFIAPQSRDLASGARTLPIALHLGRLETAEKKRFSGLLERARRDAIAQEEARIVLRGAGTLREGAFYVERYCQRARAILRESGLMPNARQPLLDLVARVSPFTPSLPE